MSFLTNVCRFLFSPRLYRIYGGTAEDGRYNPNSLEKWGDTVVAVSSVIWNSTGLTFPVLVCVGYNGGYFTLGGGSFLIKLLIFLLFVVFAHVLLRSIGRALNPTYVSFYNTYFDIISNYNNETKKLLQNYEFDFFAWPVDFDYGKLQRSPPPGCGQSVWSKMRDAFSSPSSLIGFIAVRLAAIKMIYPGSMSILNYMIQPSLQDGRQKITEEDRGERFKLRTPDSNYLDAMFVDRREQTTRGSILVICTEGNSGFYECGIMFTPLVLGYSVLGWNHPGFGSSSGTPFIDAERCAIETVMQFAFEKLHFLPQDIVLFGWSIGGFCSSFAASVYPDVKAVVLDATFDDILPLAKREMPPFLSNIVEVTIRMHANLNVSDILKNYPGPIRLIRRTEDEIITIRQGELATNRANDLLTKLLKYRYPNLFNNETEQVLHEWLANTGNKQDMLYSSQNIDDQYLSKVHESVSSVRRYPSFIGEDWSQQQKTQMALFLAKTYLRDFQSTHCTVLQTSLFEKAMEL